MQPETGLRRSAMFLGAAGAIEFGLQLLMPILLVRQLDQTAFGQYRLLWLMANTTTAIAPAFMPASLFYFMARSNSAEKGAVVGNVLLHCTLAGSIAALVASGWNPWMQSAVQNLFFQTHGLSSWFLLLWTISTVNDVLPTANGNPRWQAGSTIALALLRTLLLGAAAMSATDIVPISIAMLAVGSAKLLLLAAYLQQHGLASELRCARSLLKKQLAYALPFAAGNSLFLMRSQADQWIVISLMTPALYATFSIASVVQPLTTLIRQPVINAMMPRLNQAHARGDALEIMRLIARSNGAAGMLLIPLVGGLLAAAPELIGFIYTSRYQQAAPVMQIYLAGMMLSVVAVGHVLPPLGKGHFAAVSSFCCLLLSLVLSVVGLRYLGLAGAALGSVATLLVNELWSLKVIAGVLSIPMRRFIAWRPLGSTLAATVGAMLAVELLRSQAVHRGLFLLLQEALAYAVVFLTLFLLTGGRRQFDLVLGWPGRKAAVAPS